MWCWGRELHTCWNMDYPYRCRTCCVLQQVCFFLNLHTSLPREHALPASGWLFWPLNHRLYLRLGNSAPRCRAKAPSVPHSCFTGLHSPLPHFPLLPHSCSGEWGKRWEAAYLGLISMGDSWERKGADGSSGWTWLPAILCRGCFLPQIINSAVSEIALRLALNPQHQNSNVILHSRLCVCLSEGGLPCWTVWKDLVRRIV